MILALARVAAAEVVFSVVDVASGDRVVLDDGGELILAGIDVPEALSAQARQVLRDLLEAAPTVTSPKPPATDRYGQRFAQLTTASGDWLQGELLARGLARVATRPDQRERAADMLELEMLARENNRGLWALPQFRVRSDRDAAASEIGKFAIVAGRVVQSVRRQVFHYLNFGADWRDDFTVRIRPSDRRQFKKAGLDLEALEGKFVRVRGWLMDVNGPMIEVSHPEQIEVLE